MRILGQRLRSFPDGETGERRNWIISIIDSLRSHPDLILAKAGDWSDYNKTPKTGVHFAAGFAHEAQDLADQRAVRTIIEDKLDRTVDISAACGLGRRSKNDGVRVLERTAELLDD